MARNKDSLIESVHAKMGGTKKAAREYVNATFDSLVEFLEGGEGVDITGILKAEIRDVPARQRRNPKTGEPVFKEAGQKVHLKPMTRLKAAVGDTSGDEE